MASALYEIDGYGGAGVESQFGPITELAQNGSAPPVCLGVDSPFGGSFQIADESDEVGLPEGGVKQEKEKYGKKSGSHFVLVSWCSTILLCSFSKRCDFWSIDLF